jgi:Spy/CpxP family protein refolding chaperone
MKKYVLAAALIVAIGFASYSMADARGNYGYGPGPGNGDCGGYGDCNNVDRSDADNEKGAAFFEETKETRKEIFVKRIELDALMSQDNPDEKKVAKLTGEVYDLHAMMDEKAGKAFGDSPRYGYGRGRGGNGNCRGPRSW